ncbi:hypothetical protein TI39_contig293g00022 [Zymoseptoria brevis]|uniref:Man(5)GlcNAc(2)-PP-dolichol translocation protein RFT1 n=1 Tax=Zymoseptoria brevis TaxID=1047168 RepID=A0A0F4GVA0_9PEZI|nr:hypothetical protein TI39_contig293g00022 [Zymoseptoria brevis]
MASDTVSSSARGAGFLILLQISSRALTFALNQVLLRFLSPALLGASVQLELYIISAHHFARESLRVACQRQPEGGIQAAINLSYLAIAGGCPIALFLAQWYLSTSYPDVPYFVEALRICELAAIVELFSEPAFVAVQQNMLYKTRAAAEASAVVVKTFTTAAIVFWGQHKGIELGVLPFAAGELAYCSILTLVYLWQTVPVARLQKFSLLPRVFSSSSENQFVLGLFSKTLLSLSVSLYIQSGIKYVLTQGDVIVSTALASLEDQGMYALSANYGGLIARMVFRPIEDSTRNMFAKLCAPATTTESETKQSVSDLDNTSKKMASQAAQPTTSLTQAATILRDILRVYTIFSLIAFAVGPSAAPLLLQLVAGSRWSASGAGEVLGTYCYCIPLLAINGVSEAFVAATASTKDLHWQSIWMGAFSAGFAASAYIFLRVLELGAKGLVWANCVNMGLRIVFNLSFVSSYFERNGQDFSIAKILPNPYAIAATAVVPSLIARSASLLAQYGLLGDLVRVGGVGAVFALFVVAMERRFLLDCDEKIASFAKPGIMLKLLPLGLTLFLNVRTMAASAQTDCFTGRLADFASIANYSPAEAFCAEVHPDAFRNQTVCSSTSASSKRYINTIEARHEFDSNSDDWDQVQRSTYEHLTQQDPSTFEKVCNCIGKFSDALTKRIICSSSEYCDIETETCKSKRNCHNPARCEASSVCLNENSQACFCHPDTDDAESGYCIGRGPVDGECPDVYEDCTSNSDCGGEMVCIYACCREEPFCVELGYYGCENYRAPLRLFRKHMESQGRFEMNPS